MTDMVDQLKLALGAATDVALARELGLERSTVAQWRRRKSLPDIYKEIVDAHEVGEARSAALAARRFLYGDGKAMFLVRAALAVIPLEKMDYNFLSESLLGDHRERLIINVAQFASSVCLNLFGRPRCDSEREYVELVNAMLSPECAHGLMIALSRATLGEHL